MKPITSNILFLVITGVLVIGVGSFTYSVSNQNKISTENQIATSTQNTNYQKNNNEEANEEEDDDNYPTQQTTPTVKQITPQPATQTTDTAKTFTMVDISTHNNTSSCWSVVNGNVYDLTSYIGRHPGGQGAIKSICGVDGSGVFNNQHGGDSKPEKILQSFLIGQLK